MIKCANFAYKKNSPSLGLHHLCIKKKQRNFWNTSSAIRSHPTFHFPTIIFSLRPCFGLTINKTQGQTLQFESLDLGTPVFSHGMLYVALSRTGRKDATHILRSNVKCLLTYIGFSRRPIREFHMPSYVLMISASYTPRSCQHKHVR